MILLKKKYRKDIIFKEYGDEDKRQDFNVRRI